MDYAKLADLIAEQEEILKLDHFTNEDAFDLGMIMVRHLPELPKPMIVEIWKNNLLVFRYANENAIPNFDRWLKRKKKTVDTMLMSSLHVFANFNRDGKDLAKDVFWDPMEFAVCGGAFPLYVKGSGQIGLIAVSGQPHLVDHQFMVDCLNEYLGRRAPSIFEVVEK